MLLILLPGMDGTGFLFDPLLEALGDEYSASIVTYPCTKPRTYEDLEPLVFERLPHEDFVIVAESFSGPLVLKIAAQRPPGLRGIILCATFVSNPLRILPRWLAPAVRPWMFHLSPKWLRSRVLLGRRASPELLTLFARAQAAVSPEVFACRARAILEVDVERELAECSYPILYLQGRQDRVVAAHNLRRIRALNPKVAVREVDAPHLVLQVAPTEALRHIRDFISSLSSTPPT
jgi:pimeloyl-[acyl-carrier protein] methyl ester esterase